MKTNTTHKNWEVLIFFSISFNLVLNLSSIADTDDIVNGNTNRFKGKVFFAKILSVKFLIYWLDAYLIGLVINKKFSKGH